MALARETIYAALQSRLTAGFAAASVTLNTGPSRAFRDVDQVNPAMQPAVFVTQNQETPEYLPNGRGLPPKWLLRPVVTIYARTDQESGNAPSTALNPILDAVEKSLEWQPGDGGGGPSGQGGGGACTLGGLCSDCRIISVAYDEGLLDEAQGIVVVHLAIRASGGGPP